MFPGKQKHMMQLHPLRKTKQHGTTSIYSITKKHTHTKKHIKWRYNCLQKHLNIWKKIQPLILMTLMFVKNQITAHNRCNNPKRIKITPAANIHTERYTTIAEGFNWVQTAAACTVMYRPQYWEGDHINSRRENTAWLTFHGSCLEAAGPQSSGRTDALPSAGTWGWGTPAEQEKDTQAELQLFLAQWSTVNLNTNAGTSLMKDYSDDRLSIWETT